MSLGSIAISRVPSLYRITRLRAWPASAIVIAVALVSGLSLFFLNIHAHDPERGLPFAFSFANNAKDRWTALGGTWEVVDGSMRNESDDRGAKLLTGSRYWKNYSIDADIQLLGDGDAGLAARVSDAEVGVDSYSGYYAGLRTMDNSLVLGRAQHGWEEYPPISFPGGVHPFHWYHLNLTVRGCEISAVATDPITGKSASIVKRSVSCLPAGCIALRSYTSGGMWRNAVVQSLTGHGPRPVPAATLSFDGLVNQRGLLESYVSNNTEPVGALSADGVPARPIGSLRYLSSVSSERALVRGIVVLTTPALYVQDSTGGVEVEPQGSPALKIGDEVEALGEVEPHEFSSVLRRATVRLLWEGSPGPPLSVTPNQAATGAYDATFIQTDGELAGKESAPGGALSLDLKAGPQEFRAIFQAGRSVSHARGIQLGSHLRLRGICIIDPRVTKNLTPFVLLVRSSEDIAVIAGPPWWAWSTLAPLGLILLACAGGSYHVYLLAKHWRLRAVVEERSRLAHEIHDTLAQSFAGIAFQLQAIRNSMPAGCPRLEQQVLLACDLVRHSHEEARRSIASLRPESLEYLGLLTALQACAEKMAQRGDLKIITKCEGSPLALPLRTKDTLFRIGQEAIANVIRHAQAESIVIAICYERSLVRLRIEDDGVGFLPDQEPGGFGLVGMRKRAECISGDLKIISSLGAGAKIEASAPLPARLSLANWPNLIRQYWNTHERTNPYSYSG